jgi:hypothetical protein
MCESVCEELKFMKLMRLSLITVLAINLVACGSNKKASPAAIVSAGSSSVVAPPAPPTAPAPSGSTPGSTGQSPYNFSIVQTGASASYTTTTITTDNILRVKLRVGAAQGNNMHAATELKVDVTVNGNLQTPLYTDQNYTYGQVNETSNLIDFSGSITPGVPVRITVSTPMSDFYCTYWGGWDPNTGQPVNMLFGNYPGCRKAVNAVHTWSANLLVETNFTSSI